MVVLRQPGAHQLHRQVVLPRRNKRVLAGQLAAAARVLAPGDHQGRDGGGQHAPLLDEAARANHGGDRAEGG